MTPISICVIAKNEEKHMDNFLASIKKHMKNYPHEIVLVDTGSTDRTVEIAEKYNCKIYHFEWINDFSAARNYSIQCAAFQWILVLDCDEYVTNIDITCFQEVMRHYSQSVGLISRKNHCFGDGMERFYTDEVNRFFSKKYYHYEDIIHEQLCANDGQPYTMVSIPVYVEHFGYNGTFEELKQKAERNNELLFKMLEEDPNDPYIYFQLGQSFNLINDTEKASYYYAKGLSLDVDPQLEYVQLMVHAYGYTLLDLGRYQEALQFENLYDSFAVSAEFACLMGLIYMRNQMYIKAMREFLKATTYKECNTEGANTYVPLYNMGYINELLGDKAAAIKLYQNCGDYPPALKRLSILSQ